jgi:predicted metal-dependent hydrolase
MIRSLAIVAALCLVMAPDFVLHYIVTHEMVHLAVPDHSRKFWLTVQSLCPETERARQWLVANGQRIHLMELAGGNG